MKGSKVIGVLGEAALETTGDVWLAHIMERHASKGDPLTERERHFFTIAYRLGVSVMFWETNAAIHHPDVDDVLPALMWKADELVKKWGVPAPMEAAMPDMPDTKQ